MDLVVSTVSPIETVVEGTVVASVVEPLKTLFICNAALPLVVINKIATAISRNKHQKQFRADLFDKVIEPLLPKALIGRVSLRPALQS